MWMWIDDPGDDEAQRLRVLPLTMGRRAALAYTGISEKIFRQAERDGRLSSRPCGRSGAIAFQTTDLQRFVAELFGSWDPPIEIDIGWDGEP